MAAPMPGGFDPDELRRQARLEGWQQAVQAVQRDHEERLTHAEEYLRKGWISIVAAAAAIEVIFVGLWFWITSDPQASDSVANKVLLGAMVGIPVVAAILVVLGWFKAKRADLGDEPPEGVDRDARTEQQPALAVAPNPGEPPRPAPATPQTP